MTNSDDIGIIAPYNAQVEQIRDEIKDSILEKYKLPLLRLSTIGSQEHLRIENTLCQIIGIST